MDDKPVIELFIKVSPIGREDKGPCPISQQWFMVFYLLAEKKIVNLFVTTVNPDLPPEAYQALDVGKRLPVARVIKGRDLKGTDLENLVCDTNDEIEQLMDVWRCPALALPKESPEEAAAERCFADLYTGLNIFLKSGVDTKLRTSLFKINSYLAERPDVQYLIGQELSYADCQLMPKLHHARIAAKAYRNYDIPSPDLRFLQQYMERMYKTAAFVDSCPADRDIVQHYFDKLDPPSRQHLPVKPSLMRATCTLSLDDINPEIAGRK
ncbi:hypothetical protein BOX15_Mlig009590g3 [Macrostomum lignano]|uniref:GST C-terminal domain-containing protein n=2 Tax=Macrostomum lignano TaxID=282301 RepID=A0A1I8G5H8_9PLAT|nr:hypothetical protein BOX15_Mlig009590g2 [Macrostomum lignano]PAA64982.1 hypothetical protein BOX15_Mlig009590g1 [Macrostomum lignano]PAA73715.1 hypothetical protein BOX15_Mlig009590g3 [Macrostomum lignano]